MKKIFLKSIIVGTIIRMSKQSPLTPFLLFWSSTLTQMIRTHAQVLLWFQTNYCISKKINNSNNDESNYNNNYISVDKNKDKDNDNVH